MSAAADVARLLDLSATYTRDDLILDGRAAEAKLGKAVIDAQLERTMEGATTLTIEVADEDWSLLGEDELLGSKRLSRDLTLNLDGLTFILSEIEKVDGGESLVFYDEPTVRLKDHKRRLKASRNAMTRAQFFGMLCRAAGVRLYSVERDKVQPIAALDKADAKTLADYKAKKAGTPAAGAKVLFTVSGPGSWFGGGSDPGNPDRTTKSGKPDTAKGIAVNTSRAAGLAGAVSSWNKYGGGWWRATAPNGKRSVFEQIDEGPRDRTVDFTPKALADLGYTTANFPTDATFKLEYLGKDKPSGVDTSTTAADERVHIAKYEFRVQAGEDYLEAGTRLADEVRWRCFSTGTGYVFDNDRTLARADPSVTLREGGAGVDKIRWLWTRKHSIDELQVTVRLIPWAAPPGAVALVKGEGPADGKWLVRSIQSGLLGEERSADIVLGRPQAPKKEPASTVSSYSTGSQAGSGGTGLSSQADRLYAICKQISDAGSSYLYGGGHGPSLSSMHPSTRMDCSSSTSLALYRAGLLQGHQTAIVSGEFASSWGQRGQGKDFTVWANAGHVFIRFANGYEFNTAGHPGVSGPRLLKQRYDTTGFTPKHYPGL